MEIRSKKTCGKSPLSCYDDRSEIGSLALNDKMREMCRYKYYIFGWLMLPPAVQAINDSCFSWKQNYYANNRSLRSIYYFIVGFLRQTLS